MKNKFTLTIFAVIVIAIIELSAVSNEFQKIGEYLAGNTKYELYLPETAYPYNETVIPEYYKFENLPAPFFDGSQMDLNPVKNNNLATLGRVLFYDKNLSANQTIACASCHKQHLGFADDKAFSSGFEGGKTLRNSIALADLPMTAAHYINNGAFFWDGRQDTLENMVVLPIQDNIEMGMSTEDLLVRLQNINYYPTLFTAAFGNSDITKQRLSEAIATFLRTLVATNTKLDKAIQAGNFASFSNAEVNGMQIFAKDCWHCHTTTPIMFDGNFGGINIPFNFNSSILVQTSPHNNGLTLDYSSDEGIAKVTSNPLDVGKFKAPTLKNIALTAPYMHNGSIQTLSDVIEFYSTKIQPHPNAAFFNNEGYFDLPQPFTGFKYTPEQKSDLLAFLNTLTDNNLTSSIYYINPFIESDITGVSNQPAPTINSIYPNPMVSSSVVEFNNPKNILTHIRLINTSGQVVWVGATTNTNYPLQRQKLSAGTYIVSIEQEGVSTKQQLIII